MNLQLDKKIAAISGGSRGIGLGIAKTLAAEGASCIIGSRERRNLDEAHDILSGTGGRTVTKQLDVSKAKSIAGWFGEIDSECPGLDLLVVNGGGPQAGIFAELDDQAWQEGFELTLLSAVRLIRGAIPLMKKRGGGSIVTITSISVRQPIDNLLLSNVLRSGVVALVKSLSRELAPFGIRVNNIIPGRIETDRVRELDGLAAAKASVDVEQIQRDVMATIPLGRYGTIDEIGKLAAFVLSPAANYITGTSFVIDGGLLRSVY